MNDMNRTRAGTNEARFRNRMRQAGITLGGKRRFVHGDVEISVDESLLHNDRQYLIEVDSGNMAKLLVGQYVLLNQLHPRSEQPPFFLVVHAYKGYNPKRTVENLNLVNQQLFGGAGLEFGAMHYSDLANWDGDLDKLFAQVHRPQ